jgi:hypothetical protein
LSRIQTWKKHSNKRQKIPKHLVFFSFLKKKCASENTEKSITIILLAQLKAHDELDQILPVPKHNTIHSPTKRKRNTNSKQKRVGGLKSSNNPKAMAIFLFPRREEGFWACLLIYDSLDAKAQETDFFYSWV